MLTAFFDYIRTLLILAGYVSGTASFPKPLTRAEEREYLEKFKNGDQNAKNILIERNLRLVAHIAKKYCGEKNPEDLISVGTIGLIKGINTFDPEKNPRLSSYIARCIENEVLMHLRASQKQSREVSIEESIGADKEGNSMTWADVLVPEGRDVHETVQARIDAGRLYGAMDRALSPDEKNIIIWRYGLGNSPRKTQQEIADILGISRSYVSRIEKRCLKALFDELSRESGDGFGRDGGV